MQEHTPPKYGYIDSVRGLAILGVVLVHTSQRLAWPSEPLADWLMGGARGVQLFYLASALTLLLSWRAGHDGVLAFYIRRIFRIVPLFWLAVIVYTTTNGLWWDWQHWIPAALFINGFHPDLFYNAPVTGSATISTEMAFYVVFPLLALTLRNGWSAALFFLAVMTFDIVFGDWITEMLVASYPPELEAEARYLGWHWLPAELPVFAAGFVTYYAIQWQRPGVWTAGVLAALAIIAFLILSLEYQRMNIWAPVFGVLVYAMSSGRLILLDNPVTRALGKVSYGIFLCHVLVLQGVGLVIPPGLPIGYLPFVLLVTLLLSFGLATVLHVTIEEPARMFGKRLIKRLARPARALQVQ